MIPMNVKAMIRLMLTDRRIFLGSLRLVNGNILFPFIYTRYRTIHPINKTKILRFAQDDTIVQRLGV